MLRTLAKPIAIAVTLAITTMTGAAGAKEPPIDTSPAPPGGDNVRADNDAVQRPTEGSDDTAAPKPPQKNTSTSVDVDALRAEYIRLRDALFQSRAKVATLSSALYSTQLNLFLDYKSSRFHNVSRATIRLDGASVFDETDGNVGKSKAPRFQGYVAPGRHTVSVRIEARSKDDDRFTSVIENTFVVVATNNNSLTVKMRARDGGDIGHRWKKDRRGSYGLSLDVKVRAHKPTTGGRDQLRHK